MLNLSNYREEMFNVAKKTIFNASKQKNKTRLGIEWKEPVFDAIQTKEVFLATRTLD